MDDNSIITYLYIFVYKLSASPDVSISFHAFIWEETCNRTRLVKLYLVLVISGKAHIMQKRIRDKIDIPFVIVGENIIGASKIQNTNFSFSKNCNLDYSLFPL